MQEKFFIFEVYSIYCSGGASQGVQGVQLHPLILGPGSLNILKILSFAITKSEFAMGMSNPFKISLQSCFFIADI